MDKNIDIDISEFDICDFEDPIKLLNAINKKKCADNIIQNYDVIDPNNKRLYSIEDITKEYNITKETIYSAIANGYLKVDYCALLIDRHHVEDFVNNKMNQDNIIYNMFIAEMQKMMMNYSYKPLLILALLKNSDDQGKAELDDIIDFYYDYYSNRKIAGLFVEKNDSCFVNDNSNREKARNTILTYPVAIFSKKHFLKYSKTLDYVYFLPELWKNINDDNKPVIKKYCLDALDNYYRNFK